MWLKIFHKHQTGDSEKVRWDHQTRRYMYRGIPPISNFATAFLVSNWLCFLWHGINYGSCGYGVHNSRLYPNFLQLSPDFLQTFSRLSPDFLQTFSRLSPDILQTFSRLSPTFSRLSPTFSRHSLDILQTFPGIIQTFSRLSPDIHQTFSIPIYDLYRLKSCM